MVLLQFLTILAMSFARMFKEVHWPGDVAAGYLLGGIWLLLLIPFFIYFQRMSWLSSPDDTANLLGRVRKLQNRKVHHQHRRAEPRGGHLHKDLQAAWDRPETLLAGVPDTILLRTQPGGPGHGYVPQKITCALTLHRFRRDLVTHVSAVDCNFAQCGFVTDFIAGEEVENGEQTRRFLREVPETFAEAGFSVSQANP